MQNYLLILITTTIFCLYLLVDQFVFSLKGVLLKMTYKITIGADIIPSNIGFWENKSRI